VSEPAAGGASPAAAGPRDPEKIDPKARAIVVALAIAAVGTAFTAAWARTKMMHAPMPHIASLPAMAFTAHDGSTVTRADFDGRVTVVDFIFTRCVTSCPRLSERMAEARKALDSDVRAGQLRFLSISVDPEHDTPEVLATFAARYGADAPAWRFATGPVEDLERVVVQGFRTGLTRMAKRAEVGDIVHGEKFIVVDRKGDIRAFLSTETGHDAAAVVEEVRKLVKSGE
jgi:protein SCO1/2